MSQKLTDEEQKILDQVEDMQDGAVEATWLEGADQDGGFSNRDLADQKKPDTKGLGDHWNSGGSLQQIQESLTGGKRESGGVGIAKDDKGKVVTSGGDSYVKNKGSA